MSASKDISAEFKYQKRAETYVFNFDFRKFKSKIKCIGKTKCYGPIQFFLGDVDFKKYSENINIKVKSNKALTNFEEIVLMLMPVFPKFEGNVEIIKWISNILLKKELFDKTQYEFIQAVVGLEIENFLTDDEQKEIDEEIKMTPQAQYIVTRAIHEVNQKALYEAKQEGIDETMIEVAKTFRNQVDIGLLSDFTGLSIDKINSL